MTKRQNETKEEYNARRREANRINKPRMYATNAERVKANYNRHKDRINARRRAARLAKKMAEGNYLTPEERKAKHKENKKKWYLENHMTVGDLEKVKRAGEVARGINQAVINQIRMKVIQQRSTGYGYSGALNLTGY